MSQTWIPNTSAELDSDDTLSDSRGYLNDALEALRSSWSGTASPSSPVRGQFFIDTDDNLLYIYNGSTWVTVGDADLNYLGALSRVGGAAYAMGGDLYMGTHQIKGVTSPTLATDAATKGYVDTYAALLAGAVFAGDITMGANNITMDHNPTLATHLVRKAYADLFEPLAGGTWTGDHAAGGFKLTGLGTPTAAADSTTKSYVDGKFDASNGHNHDATDSKKVVWTDLDTTGTPANSMLVANGSGGSSTAMAQGFAGTTTGATALSTSYQTAASVASVVVPTDASVVVIDCYAHVTCNVADDQAVVWIWDLKVRRNSGDVVEQLDVESYAPSSAGVDTPSGTFIAFKFRDVPGAAGTYTYDFQLKLDAGSAASSMSARTIEVRGVA